MPSDCNCSQSFDYELKGIDLGTMDSSFKESDAYRLLDQLAQDKEVYKKILKIVGDLKEEKVLQLRVDRFRRLEDELRRG